MSSGVLQVGHVPHADSDKQTHVGAKSKNSRIASNKKNVYVHLEQNLGKALGRWGKKDRLSGNQGATWLPNFASSYATVEATANKSGFLRCLRDFGPKQTF